MVVRGSYSKNYNRHLANGRNGRGHRARAAGVILMRRKGESSRTRGALLL